MSPTLYVLLAYAGWTLFLAASVMGWRSTLVLLGKTQSNEFPSGQAHGQPLYWRLNRAHMNSVENLPIYAAVVLVAGLTDGLDSIADLSLYLLGARLLQSLIHISGNSVWHVNLRFTFLVIQHALLVWMGIRLLPG